MKTNIFISSSKNFIRPAEAAELYIELGWGTPKTYTTARMKKSLKNCDVVVGARNEAGELIGIARALSDFAIETKILDMIIAPEYQRQGIGAKMMREIERRARGTAIYFEAEPKNFGFAAKCGYRRRNGLAVFVKKR
jgi:GNAT superfamily N-acetyltransferase